MSIDSAPQPVPCKAPESRVARDHLVHLNLAIILVLRVMTPWLNPGKDILPR